MKPVLPNKRKYNYKDILRYLGITLMHGIAFIGYTLFFSWVHSELKQIPFEVHVKELHIMILLPLTLAPILNAIVHIFYAESGKTNLRAIIWLHSTFWIIAVPIVTLIGL